MPTFNSNPQRPLPLIPLILFLLVGSVSVYLGFIALNPYEAENAFVIFGYPNILISATGFILCLIARYTEFNYRSWITGRSLTFLLACFLATAFLYTREGGGFKISFDEQLLTNVSRSLNRFHLPYTRTSLLPDIAFSESIDKRPLAFPFLLSLVHGIFGYRPENAFYLNFTLGFTALAFLFKIAERIFNRSAGYFVLGLACCSPLLAQNVSGGGFEILNLLCILLIIWLAMDFWTKPDDNALLRLVFFAAFASHVRYESALMVFPVAALIIANWIRKKEVSLPWAMLAVPVLFLPLVWQYRAIASNPEKFQYQVEGSGTFSFNYLLTNANEAFTFLFVPSNSYASSPFVSFIGIASLLGLLAVSATRGKTIYSRRPGRQVMLGAIGYLLATFVMVLCFFMGNITEPAVSRLALPFIALLILAGGIGLSLLFAIEKKGSFASFVLLGLSLLYAFKMYSNPSYSANNRINDKINWVLSFAEELPHGKYLFVSTLSSSLEVYELNGIDSNIARRTLPSLKAHIEQKTYNEVFFVQNLSLKHIDETLEYTPLPYNDLGPAVTLQTVSEASLIPYNLTRISRISSIDLSLDTEPKPEVPTELETAQIRRITPQELKAWKKSLPSLQQMLQPPTNAGVADQE